MGSQDRPEGAYRQTHPFVTFTLDLAGAAPQFWMLLGEARSKCDHIRYVPLEEVTVQELHRLYLVKGVNATTAIEGNTLTEEEVARRLDGQLELPPSREYLGREIDNITDAYNWVVERFAAGADQVLRAPMLRELNWRILDGLDLDPEIEPGRFRRHQVAAGPYLAVPPADVETLVEHLCQWMNQSQFQPPEPSSRVPYAFIRAVVAHVYLEWIHPFGDGNGRLGRLVEFLLLIAGGVPLPAAHVLTTHYNLTRSRYYQELNRASRSGGDPARFLRYAVQGWVDGLTDQIKHIHRQQERLMWRAHVDRHYQGKSTPAASRQRQLAIAMGTLGSDWRNRTELRTLTPQLAQAYASKSDKTLSRDLNALADLGYLELTPRRDRARANLNAIRGLRPFEVPAER